MHDPYYYAEHEAAYQRIEQEGGTQWNALHEPGYEAFETFPNRSFLERVLAELALPASTTRVLEYGCGTGPAACFLAAQGFEVDAIDVSPTAIELARRFAAERSLDIRYEVQDICALADVPPDRRYGLVVDSFCLQSVVTDADRARLFAAVRSRLDSNGHYVIHTAMYQPDRLYDDDLRYDEPTGICTRLVGERRLPYRRHRRPAALRDELRAAGFDVLSQRGEYGGELICVPAG